MSSSTIPSIATEDVVVYPPRGGQTVESVRRAVSILDAFRAGDPTATLASLSRRLSLPRSSTLALCNTLVEAGLLSRDREGAYRLGAHLLELSRAYLSTMDLHSEFERLCRDPDLLPDQTLLLTVLDDTDVVYIGRRAGSRPIGVTYRLGMRLPANCTASGMALLSGLQSEEVRALYRGYPEALPSLTPKSVTDLDALIERLADVTRLGYALDDEETLLGVTCLGAPIIDATGHAAGAVAVSLLKASLTPAEVGGAVSELCGLADRLSMALGGTPARRAL